ncbi:MAG: hypothetical protein JRH20_13120, partial [Deltaproteobacteria bacterium]|nr:hypothetical protein [Deltaproteobacteria bacterium]
MTGRRRWTIAPADEEKELNLLLERLADLSLLDTGALLESDPTLGPALAEDLEHALESADAAVSHLMSRASRAPQD